MKTPAHTNPSYVCRRIRAILRQQGWPMHRMQGRYQPFCNEQVGTEGYSITKVGCSKSVALHYDSPYAAGRTIDVGIEKRQAMMHQAIALLRSKGYRITDVGWIECDRYDDCDG